MNVLSFGGGVQTTALAVLVRRGRIKVDMAIFADTGGEKPETYWYMANYTQPLFEEAGIPFKIVKNELLSCQPDLYGWLWRNGQIPPIHGRRLCSNQFKRETIERYLKGKPHDTLIGFSYDEMGRARKHPENIYPLIEMKLNVSDCQQIITGAGLPIPLKSSCYFCPFQHPIEWNWLKNNHPELYQKALALEAHYHQRRPDMINFGLVRGVPLRTFKDGIQPEMFADIGYSCWSGHCGH